MWIVAILIVIKAAAFSAQLTKNLIEIADFPSKVVIAEETPENTLILNFTTILRSPAQTPINFIIYNSTSPDARRIVNNLFLIQNHQLPSNFSTKETLFHSSLYTKSKLNRESVSSLDLLITASAIRNDTKNNRSQSVSDYHQLSVQVKDVNEFTPVFNEITEQGNEWRNQNDLFYTGQRKILRLTTYENNNVRKIIGKISATDNDAGEFGIVYYYLVASSHPKYFTVERTTGNIRANAILDREKVEKVKLLFKAADMSSNEIPREKTLSEAESELQQAQSSNQYQKVEVLIIDENDNEAVFYRSPLHIAAAYNTAIGSVVTKISADDADKHVFKSSNQTVFTLGPASLSVPSLNSQFQKQLALAKIQHPFAVNPETGELRNTHALAEYNQNRFVMGISASQETVERGPQHSFNQGEATRKRNLVNSTLHAWIYDPKSQLLVIVLDKAMNEVGDKELSDMVRMLSQVLGNEVAIGKISPHLNEDGALDRRRTDIEAVFIDEKASKILLARKVLQRMATVPDDMNKIKAQLGILEIKDSNDTTGLSAFEFPLIILIIILVLLLLAVILAVIFGCVLCSSDEDDDKSEKFSTSEEFYPSSRMQECDMQPIYVTLDPDLAIKPVSVPLALLPAPVLMTPPPPNGPPPPLNYDDEVLEFVDSNGQAFYHRQYSHVDDIEYEEQSDTLTINSSGTNSYGEKMTSRKTESET